MHTSRDVNISGTRSSYFVYHNLTESFTLTASPFSNEPDVYRVQTNEHRDRIEKPTRACGVLVCRRALELHN